MSLHRLNAVQLNLLLALLYLGVGYASTLLAPEPSFATGIWPPAGIAFIAVLCGGYRCLPGVFLGAAVLNLALINSALDQPGLVHGLAVAAGIGAGAALQAFAGAWLIRRFVGYPARLDNFGDIGRFLILAGPVASTISASIATVCLYRGGAFGLEPVSVHWITWWMGDTVGNILFGVIGLSLVGRPYGMWRSRRFSVAAPLLLASLPVVVAQVSSSFLLSQRLHAEFEFAAETARTKLAHAVEHHGRSLSTLSGLFAGSERVSAEEFRRVAEDELEGNAVLGSIAWLAPTANGSSDRPERPVAVTGIDADRVANTDARYRFPRTGASDAVSFAESERRLLQEALPGPNASGISADRALLLSDRQPPGTSWLVVRRNAHSGLLIAPIDIRGVAEDIMPAGFAGQLDIHLQSDQTPGRTSQLVNQLDDQTNAPFAWGDEVVLNGQRFQLNIAGLPGGYRHSWLIHTLATGGACILFSLALTLLLLADSGYRLRTERLVTRLRGLQAF